MTIKTIVCGVCKKTITFNTSHVNANTKYCSIECGNISRKNYETYYDRNIRYNKNEEYNKSRRRQRASQKKNDPIMWRANRILQNIKYGGKHTYSKKLTVETIYKILKTHKTCEYCGYEFKQTWKYGKAGFKDRSQSIDRFNSKRGYYPSNMRVVCMLCNRLKSNASIKEIGKMYNGILNMLEREKNV